MSFKKFVEDMLKQLENVIWEMDFKKRGIFANWLKRHNEYLRLEDSFDPEEGIAYKRRMVIHVDFGFRVGAEYGGFHWAAVIQNGSKKSATVVVVPLSSVKKGQKVHPKDADLGIINGLNENHSEALVGQITTISKMRIQKGKIHYLTDELLNEIDHKIIERYTGPQIKKKFNEKTEEKNFKFKKQDEKVLKA